MKTKVNTTRTSKTNEVTRLEVFIRKVEDFISYNYHWLFFPLVLILFGLVLIGQLLVTSVLIRMLVIVPLMILVILPLIYLD